MKKRVLGLLIAGVMVLGFTGCGDDETKYAVIENSASKEDILCTESALEGIQKFASENSVRAEKYVPEGTSRKDYADAIEKAVNDGAEVIVCIGDEMSVPVYEAQNDHRRTTFLLLNADPHKRQSEKSNIAENTLSLHFDQTSQGFLAGYMAVANGARDIGFMGGAETTDSLSEASGFVQGIEAAANELGLAADTVKVRYTFTGADKLSPSYMSKAMDWYKAGCELIYVPDANVRAAVIPAAEEYDKQIMGDGKSSMEESETIITASYVNYSGVVYQQLQNIDNGVFTGEQSVKCGVKENGVAIVVENSGLSDNAVSQYQAIYQKLINDEVAVKSGTDMPKVTLVSVEKE